MQDPVVRYTIFLEFIRIIFDFGLSAGSLHIQQDIAILESSMTDKDESEIRDIDKQIEQKREILPLMQELGSICDDYFDKFADYIATPTYSPDHPIGRVMMDSARENFEKN